MKIVQVTWVDIVSDDGWHTQNRLDNYIHKDNKTVRQVGYLYEEDEEQVVLLNSYFTKKDMFGDITKIPRGCIVSIDELTNCRPSTLQL